MTQPDIQFFGRNGTWVRPPGAAETDVITHAGGTADVRSFRGTAIPASMDIEVAGGYALVLTRLARQETPAPRPARQWTPGVSYPQQGPCPACGVPVLVVQGSRHGGQAEAFDPEPGSSLRHNTALAGDLSHVTHTAAKTGHLRRKVLLWRPHRYSCTAQMRIPGGDPLPAVGGYSHAAAGWKGAR